VAKVSGGLARQFKHPVAGISEAFQEPAAPGRLIDEVASARAAGQELDHLLANPVEVGAELLQDLSGDPFSFPDEPEQDVLGPDVVVAQLAGFPERELQHLLGPRRERDVTHGCRLALADDLLDLGPHGLERDPEGLE